MPEHDEFDERLVQRLRAYESRIPDGEIPMTASQSPRRSRSPLAAGGVIAIGALAGVLLVVVLLNRPADETGASPSPSASGQATPSAEASVVPSESVEPSSAAPSASAPPEASPPLLGDQALRPSPRAALRAPSSWATTVPDPWRGTAPTADVAAGLVHKRSRRRGASDGGRRVRTGVRCSPGQLHDRVLRGPDDLLGRRHELERHEHSRDGWHPRPPCCRRSRVRGHRHRSLRVRKPGRDAHGPHLG